MPGPCDPGLPSYPRPAIPDPLTGYVASEIEGGSVSNVGNPLKLSNAVTHGRINVFRGNTYPIYADKRHSLYRPLWKTIWPTSAELAKWMPPLLFGQGHMFPAPTPFPNLCAHTVHDWDSFLWLEPLPNLTLIGDDVSPTWSYQREGEGEWIASLGSFGPNTHNDGVWALYEEKTNKLDILDALALEGTKN